MHLEFEFTAPYTPAITIDRGVFIETVHPPTLEVRVEGRAVTVTVTQQTVRHIGSGVSRFMDEQKIIADTNLHDLLMSAGWELIPAFVIYDALIECGWYPPMECPEGHFTKYIPF